MSSNDVLMAERIGVTVRRVQQLTDDGVLWRRPDTNEFEIEDCARAYRVYLDRDVPEVCRQIEAAAVAVDSGLDKLREARTAKQRMRLAREVGPHIGRLNNALRLSVAMDAPASRQLLGSWTDMVIGKTISQFFELARLEIKDDPV